MTDEALVHAFVYILWHPLQGLPTPAEQFQENRVSFTIYASFFDYEIHFETNTSLCDNEDVTRKCISIIYQRWSKLTVHAAMGKRNRVPIKSHFPNSSLNYDNEIIHFKAEQNVRTNRLVCYCNTSALKIKYADSSTKTAQMNIYERFQAVHPIRSAEIKWTL